MSDALTGYEANPNLKALPRYGSSVELRIVDHPLVAHKLTVLRDETTDSPTFRRLTEELVTLLAYEATRNVRVVSRTVHTPLQAAVGVKLSPPRPLVVPILRAGLGMLEGMTRLIPTAEVGFLGMARNEETLVATTYAERLPSDVTGRQCYILDPMLATGGTLASAVEFLVRRGADHITCICLIAAPEGHRPTRTTWWTSSTYPAPWCLPVWTRNSTMSATSSLASATPVIAYTASSNAELSESQHPMWC